MYAMAYGSWIKEPLNQNSMIKAGLGPVIHDHCDERIFEGLKCIEKGLSESVTRFAVVFL